MKVFSLTVFESLEPSTSFQFYLFSTVEKLNDFKRNHEVEYYLIEVIELDKPYDSPNIIEEYLIPKQVLENKPVEL